MGDATKAVFLSYASQDAEAAKRIADALRAAGVEVWFDAEGGLEHGDEWDAKIRRQIKECVLFIAVISANTQAREEGYFRIEWELAAQRALGIASGVAFILPVVIDGTREPGALVPDRFRSVQWTKLPGGNVPPEVLQRFLKLWSHRAGMLKPAAAEVAAEGSGGSAAPRSVGRSRPVWPWLVLGVLALGVAYLIFKPRRSPEEIAKIVNDAQKLAATVTPPVPAAAPPVSEARQLVAKAHTLLRGLDAAREDFALAEEYCQRALQLDPNDGEVWAAYSQVNAAFAYRGWDTSPARKEQTRVMAERAIRLAPNSADARMAQAGAWAAFGINRDDREKLLRDILRDDPDNQGVLRFLAVTVLAKPNGLEECLAINERSAALPGGDPLALFNNARYLWSNGQPAKGYEVLQRALAQKPFTSGLVLKMAMEVTWRGDLAAAEATLRQIPQSALQEDRANYHAGLLRYYQRNAAAALEIWQAFPRDYYMDFVYEGPKGLLLGLAYELDHREAAAKIEWRAALQLVEKNIAAAPNKPAPYLRQAMLLACLGEKAAAGEALRTFEQLAGLKYTAEQPMTAAVALVYARLGRFDEIFAHPQDSDRAILRISPNFDALRADPRFAALIAAKTAEPALADWPKDPELKRAMKLMNSPEAIVSDVALAEDIVNTVLTARPTDAEATLAMGRVQVYYLLRGFDRSEERFATAKRFAERALALTPDDPEAMTVMATYLFRRNVELPRAQKLIRQAIALRPTEPLYYRMLDNVLASTPGISDAEIIASAKITAERFPTDALVQYELARHYRDAGLLVEAEHYLDVAIKLGPVANAIIGRARLLLFAHGDPAGMKAMLDQLPERYQGTDRAVFSQFSYALVTGQLQLGLDALQALPEAWMIDFDYSGPTALLQGELLLQQGKAELARLRFTEALAELGRHKIILERNFSTTWLETWLLMRLGRLDEARKRAAVFFPELDRPFRLNLGTNWWFNPVAQNLLLGEHTKALELMREAVGFPQGRVILGNALRLDPRMAPFRDDPEIKALLAEPADKPAALPSRTDDKSVAVLAFANLSDDKANEYFSDGISEELLNVLAKVPKLKVAARTSSFYFKGRNEPIPEIAQKLGVAYVVEGSVRKAGDKVRITAQLIKAADGFHVWSETYDRELKDIFAVQDEIAKNILGVVKGSLLGEAELPHATTTKIEAYTLFLQAQGAFSKRGEANLREAVRLFEAVLAIDPNYVPALVGMAKALVVLPNYAYTSGARAREATDAAKKAARRALELDPQNAAAYAVIGWAMFQCDWHWSEGLAAVRRATELAPNDSWGWNCLGDCTRMSGDFAPALKAKERAWELDPLSVNSQWDLSYTHLVAGNNDQAIHWAGLAAELGPANMDSYMPGILAAGRSGRLDLMRQILAKCRQNVHDSEGMQLLLDAHAAIMEKKPDEARQSLAAAAALMDTGHVPPAYLGYLYLLAGETDKAVVWLQRGRDQHDPAMVWNEIIDLDVIAANPTTRSILTDSALKELREIRQRNARAGLNKL